jgi:hypothetical protein
LLGVASIGCALSKQSNAYFINKEIVYWWFCRLDQEPLESPVPFRGHTVRGSKGAVAVEAEECSIVGVESMCIKLNFWQV